MRAEEHAEGESADALEKAEAKATAAGAGGKPAPIKGNNVPEDQRGKLAPPAHRIRMQALWACMSRNTSPAGGRKP